MYANSPNTGESFDPAVVGAIPADANAALVHTFGLDVDARASAFVPQTIQQVQRVGEALPTDLECWMLPGSRPSLFPSDSTVEELHAEFHRQDLSCELDEQSLRELASTSGLQVDLDEPLQLVREALKDSKYSLQCDLNQMCARATQYGVTVRKSPERLNAEECKGILRSREAPVTAPDVESLRQQVARLYALEDTPGYGPPRLKDPIGISLFTHLLRAGRVTITPQEDPNLPIPSTGWVAAGEGLPITMDVVRVHFVSLGERMSGDFVSKQMKEGWARVKTRTSLINFGYHGPVPTPSADGAAQDHAGDAVAEPMDALLVAQAPDAAQPALSVQLMTTPVASACFYKLDVPPSMKAESYQAIVKCAVVAGQITSIVAARCGSQCPAGFSFVLRAGDTCMCMFSFVVYVRLIWSMLARRRCAHCCCKCAAASPDRLRTSIYLAALLVERSWTR